MNFLIAVLAAVTAVGPVSAPFHGPAHSVSPTYSTCAKFGTLRTGGGYTIQNNEYNSDTRQCVSTDGGDRFSVTAAQNIPAGGAPASYPSIYAGCHWGSCSKRTLPAVTQSQLAQLDVAWSVQLPVAGVWDASLDLWFNSTPTAGGQPDTTEIMIWLSDRGGIQPYGARVGTYGAAQVWHGTAPWHVVSYRYAGLTSRSGSLLPVLRDAAARGYLPAGAYLTSVEAGFEIWQGGQFTTTGFSTAVR
jgi:hypothetical protein